MSGLKERFGRPLRLGIIGGGPDAWIGRMHRGAAEMDGWWRAVAGVFSSDPGRSRTAGAAMGFDTERSYGNVADMLAQEKLRPDGIDAVAIMTPNDTHYAFAAAALDAGLDVVGDKPVTHDFAQACDLVARARKNGRLFAVAHAYAAYPMTRYARALVRNGDLGGSTWCRSNTYKAGSRPGSRMVRKTIASAGYSIRQRSGMALVLSAIGCHAQHLACFAADLEIARVVADVGALVPGRKVVDYVSALIGFHGGARGTFTVTQAAAGGENDIRLRIYGEKGMLDWSHREPSYLRVALQGEPARIYGRGDTFLPAEIIAAGTYAARPSGRVARGVRQYLCRSGAGAHGALAGRTRCLPFPILASRTARTRWRSSKRASSRRRKERGSTWRGCRPDRAVRGVRPLPTCVVPVAQQCRDEHQQAGRCK